MARSDLVQEVVVLPRAAGPATGPIPEKVRQLPPRAGKAGHAVQALRAARGLGPFDVVFCGHLFAAPLAAAVARLAGAQYWQQLHGIEAWSCPGRIVRRAVEGATLVTAVSRHTRRLFLSWARNAPETVKVLPNTVDERFHPGPKPGRATVALRADWKDRVCSRCRGWPRPSGTRGTTGSSGRWPRLLPAHPDLVYVIAGDGDDRPYLEALAARAGVRESVRFVGHVPDEELPDLYRAADRLRHAEHGGGIRDRVPAGARERGPGDRRRWRREPGSAKGWGEWGDGLCVGPWRDRERDRGRASEGGWNATRWPGVSTTPTPSIRRGPSRWSRATLKKIRMPERGPRPRLSS